MVGYHVTVHLQSLHVTVPVFIYPCQHQVEAPISEMSHKDKLKQLAKIGKI